MSGVNPKTSKCSYKSYALKLLALARRVVIKILIYILDRNKLSEEDLADIHHRLFWNIVCEYRINETIIKAYLVGILGEEKYDSLKL